MPAENIQPGDAVDPEATSLPGSPDLEAITHQSVETNTVTPEAPDARREVLEHVARSIEEVERESAELKLRLASIQADYDALREEVRVLRESQAAAPVDRQPRRVRRLEDGTVQRLVKQPDGSFTWDIIEGVPETAAAEPGSVEASPEDAPPDGEPKAPEDLEQAPKSADRIVFSEELEAKLTDARDAYAEQTAKKRNAYLGHFLRGSKYLVKIPPLRILAEKANADRDADVEAARKRYEDVVAELQADVQRQFDEMSDEEKTAEDYEENLKLGKTQFFVESQLELEKQICRERQLQSKKTNKFVDWWVSRDGFKGKLAKAAVVAGAGAAVGLTAGLLAAPVIAGSALGAATGLGISTHITRRRANGLVKKTGKTVAETQLAEDTRKQDDFVSDRVEKQGSDGFTIQELTSMVEDRTGSEMLRNRMRAKTAFGLGAAGGGFGARLGGAIREGLSSTAHASGAENGNDATPPDQSQTPDAAATGAETPPPPAGTEVLGQSFDIQPGSGFTQEIMDFATANGHAIQPDQAFQLHNELLNNFGTYIQNASGEPINTYLQGADLQIGAPGSGQWAPGVANYIQNWMTTRGLW